MSISLRNLIKNPNFHHQPRSKPTSLISNPNGFHHFCSSSSTQLCSTNQRRRGQERWVCRQQLCICNGISMPMSSFIHSYSHCSLHSSNCQVSCPLSYSISQFVFSYLQEQMSPLNSRVSNAEIEVNVTSNRFGCFVYDLGSSCNVGLSRFNGQSSCLLSNRNMRSGFVLQRKMQGLSCRVLDSRAFSRSSNVDDDEEEEEIDEESGGVEDEGVKSTADPSEVERVCKVIDELFESDRNMEAVLDQCGINLSHDLVVDVLDRFKHARRPAFRFFSWAEQKPGFEHDSRTYNSMMAILGKTRQFESMVVMLDEMGRKGLLTIETFSIAIRAFGAAREIKKAVGTFELMKRYNFKADVDTYNCLLDNLGRAKLGKEAQVLFEKLKDRFTPDLKTYTVLLSGWCKLKNLIEAGQVWNEMTDKGLKPDVVAHNIMLEGLLKCRKSSEAIKLFELMKAKGRPSPNVQSYTILIRDLCKGYKMEEAVRYFDEMVDSGCKPDAAIYTCLLVGFGNQKKMDLVYELLKEMKEKGCPPDGITYNALIKLMTNRKMPDDAVQIYKRMIKNGHQPTIHTYNMMMKSYFNLNNYEMGFAVWEEMGKRRCCPDDNSYTVFIGGLIRSGRPEEACKYIEEMLEKGMRAPQLDYNKLAADFSMTGKPDILEELAQKMKFSGKFDVSDVLTRCSEMIKKRVNRKY